MLINFLITTHPILLKTEFLFLNFKDIMVQVLNIYILIYFYTLTI
jgi:hypothetical protein